MPFRRSLAARPAPWLLGAGALCVACGGMAQEPEATTGIAFTSYEGHIATSYVSDAFVAVQPGVAGAPASESRLTQTDLRLEAFVMAHGHVYHPKFIRLDVGGGPVWQLGRSESDVQSTRSQRGLYNLSAHATILPDKPYNGALFYEHLNPTLLLSPGEIFNQQSDKWGATFSLQAPVSPLPFTLAATRTHTSGESALRVMDDQVDQFTLNGGRSLGSLGRSQFGYHQTQQLSSSGSPQLPIQSTELRTRNFNIDTYLQWGADRQHDLFNSVALGSQEYTLAQGQSPRLTDARLLLHYRGTHGPELNSNVNLQLSRNAQDTTTGATTATNTTTYRTASAGATWTPSRQLSATVGLRSEDTQAPQFTVKSTGGEGSLRFEQPLSFGLLQASYGLRMSQRNQTASAAQFSIVGEQLTLSGTAVVALSRPFVVTSAVTVSNLSRTQVFVPGIDYVLSVVGTTTRVQRLISGGILDGQELLIDYLADSGGTYASTQFEDNLDLNLNLWRMVDLYVRAALVEPQLESGTPTAPLNTIRSTLYGVRAELPVAATGLSLGGFAERESRSETLAPYERSAAEVYLLGAVPFTTSAEFRAAARRTRQTSALTLQEIDLSGYDLSLGWRWGAGVHLSANTLYERDLGALQSRDRRVGSLRALWRFRQLSVTADLSRTRETQGSYVRERTAGHVVMRRDF
ncbi:MAG: hypothetical protein IPJ08_03075 [Burkholderiales bacterium]|nr:hypothetical protein [Burkholderiales bacterium]